IEQATDLEAPSGCPLRDVFADRLLEAGLGELERTKVVDHRAHRVERSTELALEIRQLGLEGLTDLGRSALRDAFEVLDFEDRVRKHLGRTVVDVPVETLALGLEAAEHALGDLDRHVVAIRRWI